MAHPFDKFFNYGEGGRSTDSPIDYVMEKLDGSLGVCWFDPQLGKNHQLGTWRITTRGSFDSEQAQWATQFLHQNYGDSLDVLDRDFTHLFEIIYPENRVVVDYGDFKGLVLLGIRQNSARFGYLSPFQMEMIASGIGLKTVACYAYTNLQEIYDFLPQTKGVEKEGFVTVMKDGSRWKFKGEDYLRLHKIISSFSFKHVLDALIEGTFEQWIEGVPDEFLGDIRIWKEAIYHEVSLVLREVEDVFQHIQFQLLSNNIFNDSPSHRKEFALLAKQLYPQWLPFLFRRLDGKLDRTFVLKNWDFSHCEVLDETPA